MLNYFCPKPRKIQGGWANPVLSFIQPTAVLISQFNQKLSCRNFAVIFVILIVALFVYHTAV